MGSGMWETVVRECERSLEACIEALRGFMRRMCPDPSRCETPPGRRGALRRYSWVERLIESGVPDGRSRLILYVVSRYLLNVKGLDVDEAFEVVKAFIARSCERYGNCSKIYDSWIRNVLRHVKRGGWKPWSLERIKREDPELYAVVESVIGSGAPRGPRRST